MLYTCGMCLKETDIKPGQPVVCRLCGHRILYKKRTKKIVQFEAR